MSRSRIVIAVLFCAALLVPTSGAEASSSVLCSGYSSCSSKGYSNYGYSTNKSKSYWRMYTGTNCTNYVAYRLVTTNGMPNTRPKAGVGNAKDWGFVMASITNSTPTVGSVAWWGRTGHHVAYVEKVVSPTEIWVSESNWSGAFDWRKITKSGSGWPDGFIHFSDIAMKNTSVPAITGTPKVGSTVTASSGSWSPSPDSYTYAWLLDGKPISGATSKTLTLTASQVGHKISASVTARRASYPSTQAATKSATVQPGALAATKPPTISGTAQVGQTLAAGTGTWSETGLTYEYQWKSDGQPIDGATSSTYVLRDSDLDRHVSVTVTGAKPGYAPASSTSSVTEPVLPGIFTMDAAPTVSGTPKVGSKLTLDSGTWSPSPSLRYAWLADGIVIDGADTTVYVPTASQVGKHITARVSAARSGYKTKTATTEGTTAVTPGTIVTSSSPRIVGSTRYGSWLTRTGGEPSTSGITVKRQWYRDGKAVSGATTDRYKITGADLSHKITVRLSYSADGYVSRRLTSGAVGPAQRGTSVAATVSSKSGTVTFKVTIKADGGAKVGGKIAVSIGSTIARAKVSGGVATVRLTRQKPGSHTYALRYTGTPTVASSNGSVKATTK